MNLKNFLFNNKFIFILIIIAITMLTSCTHKDVSIVNEYDETEMQNYIEYLSEQPDKIEQTLDSGLIIDAEINIPNTDNMYELFSVCTPRADIPIEDALELLFSDKNYYPNPNRERSFLEKDNQSAIDTSSNLLSLYYIDNNENYDVQEIREIVFWSHNNEDVMVDERTKFYAFFDREDFSFKSVADADKEIRDIFSEFGINISKDYEEYSISYDEYKKLNIELPDYLNDSALEKDFYYFIYDQEISGVNMTDVNHGELDSGYYVNGTSVKVIYSADGILEIFAEGLYEDTRRNKDYAIPSLGIDDVINKVDEKYSQIISRGTVTVNEINYEYVAIPQSKNSTFFDIVTCWVVHWSDCFISNDRGYDEAVNYETYMIFNALTGEEIL